MSEKPRPLPGYARVARAAALLGAVALFVCAYFVSSGDGQWNEIANWVFTLTLVCVAVLYYGRYTTRR